MRLKPIARKLLVATYLYGDTIHQKITYMVFSSILNLFKKLSNGRMGLELKVLPLVWMDKSESHQKKLLLKGESGVAYGPYYLFQGQSTKQVCLPDVHYYKFENARVSINSSSVIVDEQQIIIERAIGPDQEAYSFSSGQIIAHRKDRALVRLGKTKNFKKGFFLGGNGSSNYYHWVTEILARLEFKHLFPSEYKSYPLLISEDVMRIPSFKYTLELFAKNHEVILLQNESSYRVDQLVYINSPNNLPFNLRRNKAIKKSHTTINPVSIKYLRGKVLGHILDIKESSIYPNKIFLCRKSGLRDYNQDEISQLLSTFGFIKIYLEDLEFKEQVKTIYHADFIVGPTGAAWTNLIFCQTGAKGICWMAEEASNFSAYSTIASIVGVDLLYVTYKAGVVSTTDLYSHEYNIDPNLIKQALIHCDIK